jgi:hypothetical protein
MVNVMVTFESLNVKQLRTKFISISCDGNNAFQGAKTSVIAHMKENVVPFLVSMHCFAH